MDDILARLNRLESDQSALRRGLHVLSTEAVRSRRAASDALERELVARLDPGSLGGSLGARGGRWLDTPDLGSPLVSRLRDDAALSSAAPGRPDTGYPNLLADPLFERLEHGANLTGSYVAHGSRWEARYVLNSGTAPAVRTIGPGAARGDHNQQYGFENSVMASIALTFAATADVTIYLRDTDGWDPWTAFLPSWLTASVALLAGAATDATVEVTLQIVDGSDVVVAESEAVDIVALSDISETTIAQAAVETPDATTVYHWRLRVDVVASAPTSVAVGFADPLLAYSDDGTAPSFSPAVGFEWVPVDANRKLVPIDFVESNIAAGATTRLAISDAAMGNARTLPIPWGGRIVGISWRYSAAVTAGTFHFDSLINAAAAWGSASGLTAQVGTERQSWLGASEFVADDTIGVEVVTSALFAPATLELVVTLWLMVDYSGS